MVRKLNRSFQLFQSRESKTARKWGESERGYGSRSIFRAAKPENSVPRRSFLPIRNYTKTLAMQAILVIELTSSKGVKVDESTAPALTMLLTVL